MMNLLITPSMPKAYKVYGGETGVQKQLAL
jgi:hypothetical protein